MIKHLFRTTLLLIGFTVLTSRLEASATISWQLANFLQSSGSAIPLNSLGVIVADTGGNGFSSTTTATSSSLLGTTLSVGSLIGSDDKIIDIFQASSSGSGEGFFPGSKQYTYGAASVTSGLFAPTDAMAIYWFPTILAIGSTVFSNTSFGFFTSSTVNSASGGNQALVAPADGTSLANIYYFTTDLVSSSSIAPATFQATQTVVPEPSAFALLGLATFGIAAFRRTRRS